MGFRVLDVFLDLFKIGRLGLHEIGVELFLGADLDGGLLGLQPVPVVVDGSDGHPLLRLVQALKVLGLDLNGGCR